MANFYLLSVTGPKMPADLKEDAEKTVTKAGSHRLAETVAPRRERSTPRGKTR
jgi:hypothetical protein